MAVRITYFVHGTTTDNEIGAATGWNQGELSELGIEQAKTLADQVPYKDYDIMFSSDLKRAVDSANLGFEGKLPIRQDERLRECNYGELNGSTKTDSVKEDHISEPFPRGESYKEVEKRIRSFLEFLKENHDGKHVAIMAHQAPQLALEVITKDKTWEQAFTEDWRKRKRWQPGWSYTY